MTDEQHLREQLNAARHNLQTQVDFALRTALGGVTSGYDPDYVKDPEHFPGYSHQEIWDKSRTLDAGSLSSLAAQWGKIAARLEEITTSLDDDMRKEFEHWQGEAADASRGHTARMVGAANELRAVINSVKARLETVQEGASATKHGIPEVPKPYERPSGVGMGTMADLVAQTKQHSDAEEKRLESIRVMDSIYKPIFHQSGKEVPAYTPPPPAPGAGSAQNRPAVEHSGGGSGGGTSVSAPGGDGTEPLAAQPESQAAPAAAPAPPPAQMQPAAAQPPGAMPSAAGLPSPEASGTEAAAAAPAVTTSTASSGMGGHLGGFGSHGGGGGGGGFGGAAPIPSAPAPRPFIPGTDPKAPLSRVTYPLHGGGAGQGGQQPGMPGMGVGGKGAGKDKEHKSPDYLRGDHLERWIKDGMGKAAPPVIEPPQRHADPIENEDRR